MNNFKINYNDLEGEIILFKNMLDSKDELNEREDIISFIKVNHNFAAFLAALNSDVVEYTFLKSEFSLQNKFYIDLAIGDKERGAFCFIEFEDGKKDSIFTKEKDGGKSDFSSRFVKGFGQVVDWLREIDIHKNNRSVEFFKDSDLNSYSMVLVVGRKKYLSAIQEPRLKWFSDYTVVNSKKILIMTYDDLYGIISQRYASFKVLNALSLAEEG